MRPEEIITALSAAQAYGLVRVICGRDHLSPLTNPSGRAEDPLRVAVAGAGDVAVIKCTPLGGVRRSLEVAEAAGLPCVVSSALETSVGLAAQVALAGALPELDFAFRIPQPCANQTAADTKGVLTS
jgi:hypothetical protein